MDYPFTVLDREGRVTVITDEFALARFMLVCSHVWLPHPSGFPFCPRCGTGLVYVSPQSQLRGSLS
jgi:hypothetical protein